MPLSVGSAGLGTPKQLSKENSNPTWMRELRPDDTFMDDSKMTDIIIPVIGITGVGKSSFINALLDREIASVGHGLSSHTHRIQHFTFTHPDYPERRIVIIDTPGFDHTSVDDTEILRRIAVWLAQSYTAKMKLAGMIYLHEISQTHMPPIQKNLDLFQKLCGSEAIKNIILATTKWTDVPTEVGDRRELLLRERHWKPLIDLGFQLFRFHGTHDSAQHIVDQILAQEPLQSLKIQQELVDLNKLLAETDAGSALRYGLEELLEATNNISNRSQTEQGSLELHKKGLELHRKFGSLVQRIKELGIHRPRVLARRLGFEDRYNSDRTSKVGSNSSGTL